MHGLKCKVLLFFLPLTLLACAKPDQGIKVEYVDRPVVQVLPCVKASDVPKRPGSLANTTLPKNLESALSVALAKVSEWTRYGNRADAVMSSCSK